MERVRPTPRNAVTAYRIVLLAIVAIACQGRPIPLAAVRGTSVLIPIGGGGVATLEGFQMGYGSPTNPDWQRGRLRIWLDSDYSADPSPPDFELSVRGAARVRPDRSSPAGLSEGEDYWLGDQVVVVVDVPANAPLGNFDVYAARYIRQWDGSDWDQEVATTPAPTYSGSLEIVDGVGVPTSLEAYLFGGWHDVTANIPGFVPYPKFRFVVQSSTTPIGSARFTVTYPSSRLLIHGIVAEPIDADSIDWGPSALISYSEPMPGVLDVSCVAPEGVVQPAFGIVFKLTHPSDPPASGGGPVTPANFTFSNVQAWDLSGAPLSPTVPGLAKKIF